MCLCAAARIRAGSASRCYLRGDASTLTVLKPGTCALGESWTRFGFLCPQALHDACDPSTLFPSLFAAILCSFRSYGGSAAMLSSPVVFEGPRFLRHPFLRMEGCTAFHGCGFNLSSCRLHTDSVKFREVETIDLR